MAQIISGLGALTTTVDQRSGQVSQLIDSANTLSSTLAGRDQQLLSIVNNLDTVATGLAAHDQDLSNLITNVDSMATPDQQPGEPGLARAQLAAVQPARRPAVVGQHQEDLAQGVSYLGGALKGFQSIAYSGSSPVPWGNIFVNPAGADQHLRRHRAVWRVRPGAEPGARPGPVLVQRPDRTAAR